MKTTSFKFEIGSRYIIEVPKESMDTHGAFNSASVEIVSKKNFISKHPIQVEPSKVVCRILTAPSAPDSIKVIGLEYPIRRSWLVSDGHMCDCDLKKVIMVSGCKCGGY